MRPQHRHVISLRIAEINPPCKRILPQRLLHRSIDDLEYERVILELHLRFCRADVHIHTVRVNFQIDEIGRGHTLRDHAFIGLHHGLMQVRTAEKATVDKEELVPQSLLRSVRSAHKTPQTDHRCVSADIHNISRDRSPQQIHNPELQRFRWLENENVLAVMAERESDFRPCQRHFRELFDNMLEFHVVRLQKLSSCRHIVE